MEKYFITRYKPKYPTCHKDDGKDCFKSGGCEWTPRNERGDVTICKRAALKKGGYNPYLYKGKVSLKLREDCPYYSNCEGKRRYCRNDSCPKVEQVPLYRFYIGTFDDATKGAFPTSSRILTHAGFCLNSESELTITPENKQEHAELLKKYERSVAYRLNSSEDVKFIRDYLHDVLEIQRFMPAVVRNDLPIVHIAAIGKEVNPTVQLSILEDAPSELEGKIAPIERADEVVNVVVSGLDPNGKAKLAEVLNKVFRNYLNPINETEAEKWDRLSREKFGGDGWADLAKISLEEGGIKRPIDKEKRKEYDKKVRTESERIRKLVERYRSGHQ